MTRVGDERLAEMQQQADLLHPPTETTFVFRQAVCGEGPRAAEWQDKPHRLVYDLCQIIEAEAVEKAALITELVELRKGQRAVSEALTDWKTEPALSSPTLNSEDK